MSPFILLSLAVGVFTSLMQASQGETKCCYGKSDSACSTKDCDGARDYCGTSASNCKECGGVFCNGTTVKSTPKQPKSTPKPPKPTPEPHKSTTKKKSSSVLEFEELAAQGSETALTPAPEESGECCYGPKGCSGSCEHPHDYCGKSSSRCTECGGVFCKSTTTPKQPKSTPKPPKSTPEPHKSTTKKKSSSVLEFEELAAQGSETTRTSVLVLSGFVGVGIVVSIVKRKRRQGSSEETPYMLLA